MIMDKEKIWLSSPHMGTQEMENVINAFATNWLAPLGPEVDAFEKSIIQFTGRGHVAALNSGTSALHLGLVLLDIKPGDYVICQSMTFAASANPIIYQGGIPVFVDSEPDTWNMCPKALETAILACLTGCINPYGEIENRNLYSHNSSPLYPGKKPKAIIPVHLYGMPANMKEIMAIAHHYDIPVLEDAAEAMGSTYQGQACGTFGTMGIYSFNGNKIITTTSGGALISQEEELINRARFLSTQAKDAAPHYQHSEIGYNYRISNVLAGIGRGQMEVLNLRIKQRRENFGFYADFFSDIPGVTLQVEPNNDYFSNHWLTGILIDPELTGGITREILRLALAKENIEARPLWKPLHLQPVFEKYPYFGEKISEDLFEKGLCLPSGSNLTPFDFERIFQVFSEVFHKVPLSPFRNSHFYNALA